jgi:hypothetical protein
MRLNTSTKLLCLLVSFALLSLLCVCVNAQTTAIPHRITQAVDEQNLVLLRGNVHPLARTEFDQGAVSDGQQLHRMLLLLRRGSDQEAALEKLLDDQQNKSSANYHAWLTPAQFGQQFGPADADIQTITSWLQSHGFQITNVTAGRTLIEFSGTAGQVKSAFHTEMHTYLVNGEARIANASDPQIPAALAPVVTGPVSLNNFPISSHIRRLGTFHRAKGSSLAVPLYTFPGCAASCYGLGPADFATIYNSAPLLTGSPKIDGTGQTVAIVGESDIDPTDVTDFQTMFGMTPNFSAANNIIVNGADPGVNSSEGESDLDVQWAGAVAPGATIKFVTSEPTETTAGTILSAIYIVENNFAGILSESFGGCEQQIGTLNQFHNSLWEQAAAQGITVMVSAGDGGSAGCDNFDTAQTATQGLAVSGFASTPFNVAVGGTDFDEVNRWSQYWSTTNNATNESSAISYIPEIPWNQSCAQLGIDGCGSLAPNGSLNIVAGSGGVSTLYAKPSWQSGTGVPNDGHRDLPDVSLFASPGFDGTFYIVCQKDTTNVPSCNLSDLGVTFGGAGGTSASAPSFAGIMALVNQSQATAQNPAPRQGNANYVLYSLFKKQINTNPALNCSSSAASSSCTFYDITHGNSALANSTGTNSVPCAGGSPNCSVTVAGSSDGVLVTAATPPVEAYTVGTGYDLATGLGSVNVANLVKNWASVTFLPSTTTLSATVNGNSVTSISGITHGTPVNVSSSVAAGQGANGTPSGQIALMATPNPTPGSISANFAIEALSLTSGAAAGTGVILPGGKYNLTAHYQGDGTFGSSDSTPGIPVTITSEISKTLISIPTFNPSTGLETGNAPTSLVYGSLYLARIDVGNAHAKLSYPPQQICTPPACPTGTITWTDSLNAAPAAPLDGGTFALNSAGFTEDQLINLGGGMHVLSAAYSGDDSFAASSTPTIYNLTVTPAAVSATLQTVGSTFVAGTPFGVTVSGSAQVVAGVAPTGTITFLDGNTPLGAPVTITGTASQPGSSPRFSASASFTVTSAGQQSISAQYSGDANYAPLTVPAVAIDVLNPTITTVVETPSNIIYGATVIVTAVVDTKVPSTNMALKPTGTVTLTSFFGETPIGNSVVAVPDANGNWELQATATFTPFGSEYFSAAYSGDSNFASSAGLSNNVLVFTPDFSVAANPSSLTINAGQSGTVTIAVTPATKDSSPVSLTCPFTLPVGYTCSLQPATVQLANGAVATSTFTLAPSASASPAVLTKQASQIRHRGMLMGLNGRDQFRGGNLLATLLIAFLVAASRTRKPRRAAIAVSTACLLALALGCGGGSNLAGGGGGGGGTRPAATSTSLSSNVAKIAADGSVTFTATVTGKNPTGSVEFLLPSGGMLGTTDLVSGVATLNTNQLNFNPLNVCGIYAITAQYSGDSENLASQSPALNELVTGATTISVQGRSGELTQGVNLLVTLQ